MADTPTIIKMHKASIQDIADLTRHMAGRSDVSLTFLQEQLEKAYKREEVIRQHMLEVAKYVEDEGLDL